METKVSNEINDLTRLIYLFLKSDYNVQSKYTLSSVETKKRGEVLVSLNGNEYTVIMKEN